MKAKFVIFFILSVCSFFTVFPLQAAERELLLKDNLKQAQAGDYVVTAQNKNYTILLIRDKNSEFLNIEEITVPMARISKSSSFSWRQWIENGAPGNTCWVMYTIHLPSGSIQKAFSFTKNEWFSIPQSQNFLSTLLNLRLRAIPDNERKRIGPPPPSDTMDRRALWQPALIVEGRKIPGVPFDGWRTRWPKDSSELSGRIIEVFVPRENTQYPAYFPYWLQISGMIGKAKVRIVDSGNRLFSPARIEKS